MLDDLKNETGAIDLSTSDDWTGENVVSNARAQAHCHNVCPVCGEWCVQPPGHGGPCYCRNQHSGYW